MIKLEDVIDGLEFTNAGIDSSVFYNTETKEFEYVNSYDNDKSYHDDEKYIMLPSKYQIDEYSMMEEFIETIDDARLYNQLYIAISGKKAFRRFKDTCINFNIINSWYKFRDKKYKQLAIDWCKYYNIEYEE